MIRAGCLMVHQSWKIANGTTIADLRHYEDGLQSGSLLQSADGTAYQVQHRILFAHAIDGGRRFPSETAYASFFSFRSIEAMESSADRLRQLEASDIYQYLLTPVTEESRLHPGEVLTIVA